MPKITALDLSALGLSAQRQRLDIVAENIANSNTTRTTSGGPYRRKEVVFQSLLANQPIGGAPQQAVGVSDVIYDSSPFKRVYQPGHPDADPDGYVLLPNVSIVEEMVDMISATRSYEANVTTMNATKAMLMKALELGRK